MKSAAKIQKKISLGGGRRSHLVTQFETRLSLTINRMYRMNTTVLPVRISDHVCMSPGFWYESHDLKFVVM